MSCCVNKAQVAICQEYLIYENGSLKGLSLLQVDIISNHLDTARRVSFSENSTQLQIIIVDAALIKVFRIAAFSYTLPDL